MSQLYDVYLQAKVDYEMLEQQVRQCQDAHLLPGLNSMLEKAAIVVEEKFWAWSKEIDTILSTPLSIEPKPVSGLRLINGWWHDSTGGRSLDLVS